MTQRINWTHVLDVARPIVNGYALTPSLRQVFYKLVTLEVLPNTVGAYKTLSHHTAKGQLDGTFPALVDDTRNIRVPSNWVDSRTAVTSIRDQFRVDRTIGQDWTIVIAIEKRALVGQVAAHYRDYGIPVIALGGYTSAPHIRQVQQYIQRYDRAAALIYAGDFDPSGEDIDRDYQTRADCWDNVHRVALTRSQVINYGLPPQMGKAADSRARAFEERNGALVQVELDALDMDTLLGLYDGVVATYWDEATYRDVVDTEREERSKITAALAGMPQ